jgi:chromosomal replication initiation ATPase DnaA
LSLNRITLKKCERSSCSEMTTAKLCARCLTKKVAELESNVGRLEADLRRADLENKELLNRLSQQREADVDSLCAGIGNSVRQLLKVVKTIDAVVGSKSKTTRTTLDAALRDLKEGSTLPAMNARLDVLGALQAVSRELGVPVGYLCGPSHKPDVVRARHLAIAAMRRLTGASYPELGRVFRRHHTSIMHSWRAIARRSDRAALDRLVKAVSKSQCPLDVRRISPEATDGPHDESMSSSGHFAVTATEIASGLVSPDSVPARSI